MKIEQDKSGYFYTQIKDVKAILYLSHELFPNDNSLEKLNTICQHFPIYKRLIGLPDLHFKIKNFMPSGMTIPLKNSFSTRLLGPNNDGMGALKIRCSKPVSKKDIEQIFTALKEKVTMFRRREDCVSTSVLEDILCSGLNNIITDWGFKKSDLEAFEDAGQCKAFNDISEIEKSFPNTRPENLPPFVPEHKLLSAGKKNLGVLDGTSHFIEFFKVDKNIKNNVASELDIAKEDYFFLIHAGSGDPGIIAHRAWLTEDNTLYSLQEEQGQMAFNAFAAAANFGYANRLFIYKIIKEVLQTHLPQMESFEIFSDCPHDYLQKETIDETDVFTHRKGSVLLNPASYYAFSHPWNNTGTPYLFPSTVGGDAYIVHNAKGNSTAFNTVSHGAGRLIKKDAAIEKYADSDFESALKNEIMLFRYGVDTIEGQNPLAFKDIDVIMQLFKQFKLAQPISKLLPIASLKG